MGVASRPERDPPTGARTPLNWPLRRLPTKEEPRAKEEAIHAKDHRSTATPRHWDVEVRHEAPWNRAEVKGLRHRAVAAAR